MRSAARPVPVAVVVVAAVAALVALAVAAAPERGARSAPVHPSKPAPSNPAPLRATPETLASVFDGAGGGEVIALASGDYGTFAGAAKPATVTLAAAPGAHPRIAASLDGAAHLRFEGLTVTSAQLVRSYDIAFVGNRFTGTVRIDTVTNTDERILFDGNAHEDIDVCPACFEGRITVRGENNTAPNGVRIVNSSFSGGNADGVQVIGSAYGTQIGPGNRFRGLVQGDPSKAHTDPIQLYGSSHTVITGNDMRGNTTGIMAPDGADHEVIEHNVITTDGYPWGIVLGSDRGSIVRHNRLPGGACNWNERCGTLRIDAGNRDRPSRGTVVRDNVLGALTVSPDSRLAAQERNTIGSSAR
jgi:hypothetical protein